MIWRLGKPSQIENALYSDGTLGEAARHMLDHGFGRRATGERLWIYGRIDIRPDDVIFIDGDQPVYQPPPQGQVPDLGADPVVQLQLFEFPLRASFSIVGVFGIGLVVTSPD